MEQEPNRWHHRPCHVFEPNTMYMVTSGTSNREHFFAGDMRLRYLRDALLEVFDAYDWQLEAWVAFPNHYHVIARSPGEASTLRSLLQRLHSQTAREANRWDNVVGRKVWFEYWDTCLTYEASYYARLNYVHHNAVHHGVAATPESYPYGSAIWFNQHAEPAFRRKVATFKFDKVRVVDEF